MSCHGRAVVSVEDFARTVQYIATELIPFNLSADEG